MATTSPIARPSNTSLNVTMLCRQSDPLRAISPSRSATRSGPGRIKGGKSPTRTTSAHIPTRPVKVNGNNHQMRGGALALCGFLVLRLGFEPTVPIRPVRFIIFSSKKTAPRQGNTPRGRKRPNSYLLPSGLYRRPQILTGSTVLRVAGLSGLVRQPPLTAGRELELFIVLLTLPRRFCYLIVAIITYF